MLRIITLFFALSLILTVDAHIDTFPRRHAPAVNRMIKKRGGINNIVPQPAVANAGSSPAAGSASATTSPDVVTPTDTPVSSAIQLTPAPKPSVTTSADASTPTPSTSQSSSASTPAVPLINTVVSVLSPNASTSSSSSSSPSTSAASSTSLTSSPSSSPPSPTPLTPSTPAASSLSSIDPVTYTRNATAPATTPVSTSSNSGSGVTKLQRNTIIILIAIGASIGAAGVIWTIIRKWKFSPSRSSDDRLQPIDWQPTTGLHEDHDITEKLARNDSTRSHGSFTSGNNHDNIAPELPAHDFTAGPAHLAPVGGYADLQRGPSPQPDLQRGQSFRTQPDYQYEIPNPHGQFYNGGMGAGAGAYQGGYDYNRGY